MNADLAEIDFTKTLLVGLQPSQFSKYTTLNRIHFLNANLQNTRFNGLYLTFVDFRDISHSIDFSNTILMRVMFENINRSHLNFSYSNLIVDVTFTKLNILKDSSFFMADLNTVQFSGFDNHLMENINFDFANLTFIDFVNIRISHSSFINSIITHSNLTNCKLINSTLINMTMSNIRFDVSMIYVQFDNSIINNNVNFLKCNFISHSTFRQTQMQNIKAEYCEFISVDI